MSALITLSHDEAKKLGGYLDSLSYEYGGILSDVFTDEERDSFTAKNERNNRMAAELSNAMTTRGPVTLPRPIYEAALDDLSWLVGEWNDAINYMDRTDAASYRPRIPALERFIAAISGR